MKLPVRLPPPQAAPFDVVGTGESSLDFLATIVDWPQPDSKAELSGFAIAPGGQMATAMVACARLGWRAKFVGAIGDDEVGARVAATLADEGVATHLVRRSGASSRMAVVLIEPRAGRRTVLFRRESALSLEETDVPPAVFTSGRILMLDATDLPLVLRAAPLARAAGIPTMIDVERWTPGLSPVVAAVDIVIAPAVFFTEFAGGGEVDLALERFAGQFEVAVSVATLGSEGSLARCGGATIRTPAVRVPVVDTTGAGDAFRGGFASGWLQMGSEADARSGAVLCQPRGRD